MPRYHLGMDDTDSLQKGCTTYIGALMVRDLLLRGCKFFDYPNLIRLNPNIPWKSRGNAAVCLRFETELNPMALMGMAVDLVEEYRDSTDRKNQPGIALLEGDVPDFVCDFGKRALFDVLSVEEAVEVASRAGMRQKMMKGGRGLVGAVASIGNTLARDHTYELVVYRGKELWGKKRVVDYGSVLRFDRSLTPQTFNNIDYEAGKLLITPHGPDPILFGVRGESAETVMEGLKQIIFEGGERWVVYRSNQGTAAHLVRNSSIAELRPYQAAILEGEICGAPSVLKGSHVIGVVKDKTGVIDIAGYEPSGGLRRILRGLIPGDKVKVFGGVRVSEGGRLTFNLEKLDLLNLVHEIEGNPRCLKCHKSMKSEGRGKGYQCRRCGLKSRTPAVRRLERGLELGSYLPPPKAMRHLTKPFIRMGQEKLSWDKHITEFYGEF